MHALRTPQDRVFYSTALDFGNTLCDTPKKIREAEMDIFKNAWFTRFARKEKISVAALHDAVDRAERGLIDADLGPGVGDARTF